MTNKELFDKLKAGAKWDVGVSINRTNPLPLDANSLFDSVNAATDYAKTNVLAYQGQIISVVSDDEISAYVLGSTGENAALIKLASTSVTGDLAGDVATLQGQVTSILSTIGKANDAAAEGGSLFARINAEIAARKTTDANLTKEAERADAAEKANAKAISDESTRAKAAEAANTKKFEDYYTKDEINTKVSSVFKFRGTVATVEDLAKVASPVIGDVYHVTAAHAEYVYAQVDGNTAASWEELGPVLDLTPYATKESLKETDDKVEAIKADYLTSSDKTELSDKIGDVSTTLLGKISDLEKTSSGATEAVENKLNQEIQDRKDAIAALPIADGTTVVITEDNKLTVGAIAQTQVTGLPAALNSKVDKVEGSSLMTEAEHNKLAGIADKAQVNVLEGIKIGDKEVTLTDKIATLGTMAGKSIISEADLDEALKAKVNPDPIDVDDSLSLESNTLGIKKVTTDKLVNGDNEFIIDGGKAA